MRTIKLDIILAYNFVDDLYSSIIPCLSVTVLIVADNHIAEFFWSNFYTKTFVA